MGNDSANKPADGDEIGEESHIYEDEICLMDYFRVLWKHRWLILLGSVLPTLIAGLAFFSQPRAYTVMYTYNVKNQVASQPMNRFPCQFPCQFTEQPTINVSNWNLDKKNYDVLLDRFYREENISKIATRLQQEGISKYTKLTTKTRGRGAKFLEKLVKFEVLPPYVDLAKIKTTDPAILESLGQLKAQILNITIAESSKEDLSKMSSIVKENLETVISVYLVAEQLNRAIRQLEAKMAAIEEGKFFLQLALKKNSGILSKLRSIKIEPLSKNESNIILQFDVDDRSEYLPIEYQIQIAQSKIIQLEETVQNNENEYNYYSDLVDLNNKLLAEINNKESSDYTIQQFLSFLLERSKEIEKQELKDYLNSYIRGIENRIAVSVPVSQAPKITSTAKDTIKKCNIVFAVALLLSIFASFALEGLKKTRLKFHGSE